MAYKTKHFDEAAELLRHLPDGTYFDIAIGEKLIQFQASTRAAFRSIRASFPGIVWTKTWRSETNWWQFDAVYNGWKLQVYACYETPATCRAITETRKVKIRVPVSFYEREEEKSVIVGWDCGTRPITAIDEEE